MRVINEKVTHPSQSFRFLRYETDVFRTELHRHGHLELTWIERGCGVRLLGDSALPYESGDLALVGPGVPHAWMSSPRGNPETSIATVIQFSHELLAQMAFPELLQAVPLVERSGRGIWIRGACQDRVIQILATMPVLAPLGRLAGLIEILGLLVDAESNLAPIASSPMRFFGDDAKHQSGRRIDKVISWVHRQLAIDLKVSDAAEIANVTPAAFSRYFRHEVGKPFTQYVNDVRCSAACIKLRQTDKPVSAIAEECGFSTMSHFNRQFMLRTGVSPRTFRHPEKVCRTP